MSEEKQLSPTAKRDRGIRLTVLAIVSIAIILVGGFFSAFTRARVMTTEELKSQGAYLYENPRLLPNFTLENDRGERITPTTFQGQWSVVFFGFTYCPDVCPTTLAQLKAFYLDPARDTPERLHSYLDFFHPAFRGITGDFLEIHRFATSLNIPFTKVPGGGSNYLVEHSANVALINPKGHSVGFFKAPLEISKMKRAYLSIREYY